VRWWALALYASFFVGIVAGGNRLQRQRVIDREREKMHERELAQARETEHAYAQLADSHQELKRTQDQLVQQEKLASLGQLTAGIAHEIKNPLNFVNNFSDLSIELVEEIREELRQRTGERSHLRQGSGGQGKTKSEKGENPLLRGDGIAEGDGRGVSDGADDSEHSQSNDAALGSANTPLNPSASWRREAGLSPDPDLILDILNDIEANLKTIHKHGSRADSIVKSMLQHSRGGDGKMEPTPLNPLIKEYVNLAFHGMRAGKDPINVDIDLQLDENVGEVPVIAEDFSRVILNLTNNAFDAMREKVTEDGRPETVEDTLRQPTESGKAERSRGVSSIDEYTPKLSVRTKSDGNTITIEIEDNGHGIPDDMKDKILQPFFTTKKGTAGTGLGLSITNDIIKAHGGYLSIPESDEAGTTFRIELKATE
jgi:signal transduction histidine kinase